MGTQNSRSASLLNGRPFALTGHDHDSAGPAGSGRSGQACASSLRFIANHSDRRGTVVALTEVLELSSKDDIVLSDTPAGGVSGAGVGSP